MLPSLSSTVALSSAAVTSTTTFALISNLRSSSTTFQLVAATASATSALRACATSNDDQQGLNGFDGNSNGMTSRFFGSTHRLNSPSCRRPLRLRGGGGGGREDPPFDASRKDDGLVRASSDDSSSSGNASGTDRSWMQISPRATSCIYMALAMALHFGGYEFARSAALALFTSSNTGFNHPAAYPFAIGLVTPTSLTLLYWYGLLLKAKGPRLALKRTKTFSISFLAFGSLMLALILNALKWGATSTDSTTLAVLSIFQKLLVGILFVFQNSYAHLLYTQQWSFLGSVMTPTEGTQWFSTVAGLSSIICTATATTVHTLAPTVGLLGLMGGTCITLALSLWCADHAYSLSETHGFDPAETMLQKQKEKKEQQSNQQQNGKNGESEGLLSKTSDLFRRVPTLAALFSEVICFQSLSTILNVCFVRQLKESIPSDTDRAAYSGQFYAYINGSAGILQFFVLPFIRRFLEPKWAYKVMPMFLLPILFYLNWTIMSGSGVHSLLWLTASAFFCLKTLDYSVKGVVNEMVYQPLDFDSRYLGKEVIGVFANRFGKSGMSLLLSLATATLGASVVGVRQLSQFSLVVGSMWTSCSWCLSGFLLTNKEAEQQVQDRKKKI